MPRLRLLTGTRPQRAALLVALTPVVREFLPVLDKPGQDVRAIVLVPTLSGSDGEPLLAEVEQVDGSTAFIVRLAHRLGGTVRQPDEMAAALADTARGVVASEHVPPKGVGKDGDRDC